MGWLGWGWGWGIVIQNSQFMPPLRLNLHGATRSPLCHTELLRNPGKMSLTVQGFIYKADHQIQALNYSLACKVKVMLGCY